MERERGERRGGVGAIGARGMRVAARAMERGRGEAGERSGGVGAMGARGMKVAAGAKERGRRVGGNAGDSAIEYAARAASAEDASSAGGMWRWRNR
jgi:hypothetical protein